MPSITNSNHAAHQDTSRRSYITSGAFNDHFYTYSINEGDAFPVGTLVPVTTDPGLCPSGRVLRETGRKLFPGVHPGVTNMMVMVYDDQTLLKGFINPNYTLFSTFSTDKSYFVANSTEPTNTGIGNTVVLATEQLGYRANVPQVQQLTSKTTAVTINGPSGTIITAGESLAAGNLVSFRLNNTSIEPNDFLLLNHMDYIGDIGRYTLNATCGYGYAQIHIRNITSSNLAANQVIQFVVLKVRAT